MKEKLSIEYLKEALDYNGETGEFTWKTRPLHHFKALWAQENWNKRWAGKIAGWKDKDNSIKHRDKSYCKISVNGENYKAHRLAWVFITGDWPYGIIDHINGDSLDNSQNNLRVVTDWENATNQRRRVDNKSGVTGVGWQKSMLKWYANGRFNNQLQHLGFFEDKFEAICARKSWEVKNNFHRNHGRG